jgi:hypothetical protein
MCGCFGIMYHISCYLCCSTYCLCVNVYCHRVTIQLLLIKVSYLILSYLINLNTVSQLLDLYTGQSNIPVFTLPISLKSWSLYLKIFTNSNHDWTNNTTQHNRHRSGWCNKNCQQIIILKALGYNLSWTPAVLTVGTGWYLDKGTATSFQILTICRSYVILLGASDNSMCPGVDSASKNEYQDIPRGKDGRYVRVMVLPPSCAECLEILEP